jgi:Tfp pilus assembly protein PilF
MAELGIVQYKLGRDDRAEEALRKAIALDSGKYTCPYEGLGLLYLKQGKIDKAKKNLKKAIDLNPDIEYKKFNALAKIYLKEGKEEKAKKLLRKSIANFPYNNEAKRMLETLESDESG